MVLRLADTLAMGLRDTNDLLHAAGLAASYPTAAVDSVDLAPYRAVVDRLLASHEPYPGMVLDGHFTVLAANRPCRVLFGSDLVGVNFVRDALAKPAAAEGIVNWPEVAWAGVDRLRRQHRLSPFDVELGRLVTLAENALTGVPRPEPTGEPLVCPWFRVGEQVVRTVAMVARFDHPADTTLDELRVELLYPMDEAAEQFFRSAARHPRSGQRLEATDATAEVDGCGEGVEVAVAEAASLDEPDALDQPEAKVVAFVRGYFQSPPGLGSTR
jgi:hypothetical protein